MNQVSFREAFWVWLKIGFLSFGGPAGQISLMHNIIVDEKKWLDEKRFLHALNYCMLLPGPEAQQLATYVGWLLHGVKGGLVAGTLFILPGMLMILGLSWLYVLYGDLQLMSGVLLGLKAAVLAIVFQALIRIAGKALKSQLHYWLATAGFVALFAFNLPFPLVVLGAGIIGFFSFRLFSFDSAKSPQKNHSQQSTADLSTNLQSHWVGTKRTAITCAVLWIVTVAGFYYAFGANNVFTEIALFFSKMAMVTFGGAYAVLAYVAQQGVEHYQWLQPGEMLDGLGLAETTPGPLILVTQFVGFLAAYREAGVEPDILMGSLGALLTVWVTFLPCFLWIFAGAPYIEKLHGKQAIAAALSAVTAAVVGVIANLGLWFGINALFESQLKIAKYGLDLTLPQLSSLELPAFALTVLALLMVFLVRLPIIPLVAICGVLGMTLELVS